MPISTIGSDSLDPVLGIGTTSPSASAKVTIANGGNQLYLRDTRNANSSTVGLITYNQDGNLYYDSNTLNQSGAASGHIWRSTGTQYLSLNSAGTLTLNGEFKRMPTQSTAGALPLPFTYSNRTGIESALVAPYSGTSGSVGWNTIPSSGLHYIKKFFNMNNTTNGSFNQTLVEIDGRTTSFHELWIKITWGTRIQGISDATSAMCERAYGCNKFNGLLINYNIGNNWNHIDGNSDAYMDINVVNSPTTGMLLVQYQQASPTSGSSFVWGYIEIMSQETLSDNTGSSSGIPVRFNC
jgi:hypothetical protein